MPTWLLPNCICVFYLVDSQVYSNFLSHQCFLFYTWISTNLFKLLSKKYVWSEADLFLSPSWGYRFAKNPGGLQSEFLPDSLLLYLHDWEQYTTFHYRKLTIKLTSKTNWTRNSIQPPTTLAKMCGRTCFPFQTTRILTTNPKILRRDEITLELVYFNFLGV